MSYIHRECVNIANRNILTMMQRADRSNHCEKFRGSIEWKLFVRSVLLRLDGITVNEDWMLHRSLKDFCDVGELGMSDSNSTLCISNQLPITLEGTTINHHSLV